MLEIADLRKFQDEMNGRIENCCLNDEGVIMPCFDIPGDSLGNKALQNLQDDINSVFGRGKDR